MTDMDMEIKIETTFLPLILAYDDLPDGVELIRIPQIEKRDLGYESVAVGVLSFGSGVAASIIAAWIYDKIKRVTDRPEFKLKISGKEIIKMSAEEITKIIETEIQIQKKD